MIPVTVTPAGPGSKPGLPARTPITLAFQCCGVPVADSLPEELFLLEPLPDWQKFWRLRKRVSQCLSSDLDRKDVFNTFFSSLSVESHVRAQW